MKLIYRILIIAFMLNSCSNNENKPAETTGPSTATEVNGDVLPFPPVPSGSVAGLTMEQSTYKKRVEPKHLPEDAPNILIILMDDVGPGTASTYGGEINTPTLSRVANMGISYNRFHSTAMCSPTRAALLLVAITHLWAMANITIANDFDEQWNHS
jgi:arylsulfatase